MGVLYRIKFHTKMKIQSIKNWWEETVLHKTDDEILDEFNSLADSIPQEEKHEIARILKEQFATKISSEGVYLDKQAFNAS